MKVAFPGFNISKFSGGGFPETPLHVDASSAHFWAPPSPNPIQNTLRLS